MKEPIILIKAIKRGCYSDNPEERANSRGGFLMREGATYTYGVDPNWANGKGYYCCETHIIMEEDIDWDMFIVQSKYYELINKVKKELLNQTESPNSSATASEGS